MYVYRFKYEIRQIHKNWYIKIYYIIIKEFNNVLVSVKYMLTGT